MESTRKVIRINMDNLFEAVHKQCPNCGAKLYRPKQLNRQTGQKMHGACPKCGYKEMIIGEKQEDLKRDLLMISQRSQCVGYFKKYSIILDSKLINSKKFANFRAKTSEQIKALTLAKNVSQDVANNQKVHAIFIGQAGRGKTHLANAIANDLMIRTQYQAKIIFINVAIASEMNYGAISDQETANKLNETTENIKSADLVILDDVGTERNTEWGKYFIDEIARYREEKSLILTTNLSTDDFKKRYSERTLSRLRYHAKGYSFVFKKTEDYRKLN